MGETIQPSDAMSFLVSTTGVSLSVLILVSGLNAAIGMIFGRGWRGFLWGLFFGPLGWIVAFRRAVEVEQIEREEVREGRAQERHAALLKELRAARIDYLADRETHAAEVA